MSRNRESVHDTDHTNLAISFKSVKREYDDFGQNLKSFTPEVDHKREELENTPDVNFDIEGILSEYDGSIWYEDNGFRIKQVPEPSIVRRQLSDLYKLCIGDYLVLDPPYQREVVWDEGRAAALIQSILQNYYIPPIVFNVHRRLEDNGDGSGMRERFYRVCVDGKQRLTAIKMFMEGLIGITDTANPPRKWFYCHNSDLKDTKRTSSHMILPEATKKLFTSKTFFCYEYSELSATLEETTFQLVQRGMALTTGEKLRALTTAWSTFAKQYVHIYDKVAGLIKKERGSSFRVVVQIFCQTLEVLRKRNNPASVSRPTLKANSNEEGKLLVDDDSLNDDLKALLKTIFDKYAALVDLCIDPNTIQQPTANRTLVTRNSAFDPAPDFLQNERINKVNSFSPLELLATAILILVHMRNSTDEMLLNDIKELRYYLRQELKDIRLNVQSWNKAWTFIDIEIPLRRERTIRTETTISRKSDSESEKNDAEGRDSINNASGEDAQANKRTKTSKSIMNSDELKDDPKASQNMDIPAHNESSLLARHNYDSDPTHSGSIQDDNIYTGSLSQEEDSDTYQSTSEQRKKVRKRHSTKPVDENRSDIKRRKRMRVKNSN